ncbi:MAG: DUF5117 domain-containing protein [Rikenellaceae bacterium]|nr:DUF5117 domain-containing protein [Rikenellaceae bacterium]
MKKKIFLMTALLGMMLSPARGQFGLLGRKKARTTPQTEQKDTTQTARQAPVSRYERLFRGKEHTRAEGGFMTLHLVEGKLYFELPVEMMDRQMLLASTVTRTTDNTVAVNGYKANDPLHLVFTLENSLVYMRRPNARIVFDEQDQRMNRIVQDNYLSPALDKYRILAYNPDSTAVVFEMTALFTGDDEKVSPVGKGDFPMAIRAVADKSLSKIEQIKSFPDNVTIRTAMQYKVSAKRVNTTLYTDRPVAVTTTRTLLLLPEEPMRPRISDSRVGTFLVNKQELSNRYD